MSVYGPPRPLFQPVLLTKGTNCCNYHKNEGLYSIQYREGGHTPGECASHVHGKRASMSSGSSIDLRECHVIFTTFFFPESNRLGLLKPFFQIDLNIFKLLKKICLVCVIHVKIYFGIHSI